MFSRRTLPAPLLLAALISCADLPSRPDPSAGEWSEASQSQVQSTGRPVAVSPKLDTLRAIGHTRQLSVTVRNGSGKVVGNAKVTWRSLQPEVASVNAQGLVQAVSPGTARITATASTGADTATIVVRQVPATVVVAPANHQMEVDDIIAFHAVVSDTAGHTISGAMVGWSSSDPSIAVVDANGLTTARAAGSTSIHAVAEGATGSATLTVRAKPTPPPPTSPPPAEYSVRSPHWSHIRTMITDFRYPPAGELEAERNWTAAHYDWIVGSGIVYKPRNPTVTALIYSIYHTVMIPGRPGSTENIASGYYRDMEAWFAQRPDCNLERAFLHTATPIALENRKERRVWTTDRWSLNLSDACTREYTADRITRHVNALQGDMAFIDEHGSIWPNASGVVEYGGDGARYWADDLLTIKAIRERSGKVVNLMMLNTASYKTDNAYNALRAAGAAHLESDNYPMTHMVYNWGWHDRLIQGGVITQLVTPMSHRDYANVEANGSYPGGLERGRIFELASYYMISQRDVTRTLFTNVNVWDRSFKDAWTPAIGVNVGLPLEDRRRVIATTDPTGQRAHVFFREFENALIVVRPQADWSGSYGNATAIPVSLPATDVWHPVKFDASLGSPVTELSLRIGEAAILLKQSRMR